LYIYTSKPVFSDYLKQIIFRLSKTAISIAWMTAIRNRTDVGVSYTT